MKHVFFLCCLWLQVYMVQAQEEIPKREFRAAWVATVGNIDWPSKQGLDAYAQKQEFITLLDLLQSNRLNAVIVQIRPAADALYNSPYENWSRYLSGKQGVPPTPYYDPLEFMIEECHKRCMEFHAWFNPYRALVDANKNLHTANHVTRLHPEWFLNYGGKKYFDPGLPEVKEYFIKIVLDVVKRYDIDAVHFDDYFYPYRIAGQEFPDFKSYSRYGTGFASKDDWRRDNVNKLVETLSKKIKEEKSWVKFGISPFGVWRNFSKDPEGSRTNGGQTNYDDLFADVILWLKKGWIDYVLPQLYWERGHRAADYTELLRWWGEHAYGRHLYIGHGLYNLGSSPKPAWKNLHEIEGQVDALRKNKNVQGSAYYSAVHFKKNIYGLNGAMRNYWNPYPALLPEMPWIKMPVPKAPVLKVVYDRQGNCILSWTIDNKRNEALQYVVYRYEKAGRKPIMEAENIITITRELSYTDQQADAQKYTYVVTALNRLHGESEASNRVD